MKVTVESLSPIRKKLSFEIPYQNFLDQLEKTYRKIGSEAQIKGFRKGKAPRDLLEKHYKEKAEYDALNDLIDHAYQEALKNEKITPLAPPKLSDLKYEKEIPISYAAEIEVQPVIELSSYRGIPLQKPTMQVSTEEIEKEIEGLRHREAQFVPVSEENTAQKEHIALIDFVGEIDGKPFKGGSANKVPVEIGAGRFLPDFEAGLIGMKQGETKKVSVQFPEEYQEPSLKGKTAVFNITLHELKEKILPEVNDDFARNFGEYDTLDAFKEEVKKRLIEVKENEEKQKLHQKMLDYLILQHPFEVPGIMIEHELKSMLKDFQERLAEQKIDFKRVGISEEQYFTDNRENAIRRIKAALLFDAVATAEKIRIEDSEVEEEIKRLAVLNRETVDAVRNFLIKNNLGRSFMIQILERKIFDFLLKEAVIEAVS